MSGTKDSLDSQTWTNKKPVTTESCIKASLTRFSFHSVRITQHSRRIRVRAIYFRGGSTSGRTVCGAKPKWEIRNTGNHNMKWRVWIEFGPRRVLWRREYENKTKSTKQGIKFPLKSWMQNDSTFLCFRSGSIYWSACNKQYMICGGSITSWIIITQLKAHSGR